MKTTLTTLLCTSILALLTAGCGGDPDSAGLPPEPENTSEAASQLEEVFAESPQEVQQTASAATEALRTGDYEKAAVAVNAKLNQPNLTFQQGMVARNSMVALQKQLVQAAEDGDPQAKRAFEMLKRMNPK